MQILDAREREQGQQPPAQTVSSQSGAAAVFGPPLPPASQPSTSHGEPTARARDVSGSAAFAESHTQHRANTSPPQSTQPSASPLPTISSTAVDDIISRAGPEVRNVVQSTRPVALPAGTAVTYEIVDGAVTNVDVGLEIKVTRSRLLPDLIEALDRILAGDRNTLLLPLK
jgi:hypothetical protein